MSASPAHPRRRNRAWQPPEQFTYYRRKTDGRMFQVRSANPRVWQVTLEPCRGTKRDAITVWAFELARDYERVPGL